jgi:hypothetical protein
MYRVRRHRAHGGIMCWGIFFTGNVVPHSTSHNRGNADSIAALLNEKFSRKAYLNGY